MAAQKVTALTNLVTPQPTMLLYAGLSPFGATDDRKITANALFQEITANVSDVSIQFGDGVAAAVSAASKGKIIYNATSQAFQISENGAAYTNLIKGSGANTRVAFWTGAATLSSDSALLWDSSNDRLLINVSVVNGAAPIDVLADGSAIAQRWRQNGGAARVEMQLPASFGQVGTVTAHDFAILTNGTQRINVESGGAVVVGSIVAATGQFMTNALADGSISLIANNTITTTVDIARFQVNSSNRFRFLNTGEAIFGLSSSLSGKLTLAAIGNTNTQTIQSADSPASSLVFKLPTADPTAGYVLTASAPVAGIVTLSWSAGGGGGTSPGGSNTQIQFNNAGTFDGSANLTWVSPVLTIGLASTATGRLTLAHSGGSTTTSFEATNAAASLVYQLPATSPSAGQFLQAAAPSGANVALSWATAVTGSGTATRVAFWSGTSALSSSAALFWDNTNARLGIGTATPGTSLDVVADGSAIAQQWRENGAGTCRVQLQIPSSFGQIGTTTTHDFAILTNATQRINVESGGAVVVGSIVAATAQLMTNALTTGSISLIANNLSGTSADIAQFQVNAANRFRFLNTGELIAGLASTATGKLTLANASGPTLTSLSAGNAANSLNYILPVTDPTAGQFLRAAAPSGGNVTLSWGSATAALTATYMGFGDGSNLLTGTDRLTWDNTARSMTLGESGNSGQVQITLRSTSTASALLTGSAAARPGSQGGVIFPNVGGDQTQGPGLTWSDGTYGNTSRLYLSLGLNWQGYDTGGQAIRLRKSTATGSQGDVVFEFRPNDGYLQIAPFGTSAGNTTEIRFLELAANGFNYVSLRAPDSIGSTNPVIVLPPNAAPSVNDVLTVSAVSSGVITTAWQAGGGGGISGSGTVGTLAKFTGATAVGNSILSESATTLTAAGRLTLNGLTINTDANNTVASLTANSTFTKNDSNTRTFFGVLVQPTFNFGGSNASTTVNLLAVNTTNTSLTGLTVNLLNLAFGGAEKFNVDSNGAITFANGVRQSFAPSATTPSLNVGTISGDPSSPVNGDIWYDSTNNLLRARINSVTVSLGAGGGISPGGSSGQIQYNNAGNFGGTNLSFASSVLTQTLTSLGTTVTDSLVLSNSTAAAAGAQQISPALILEGQGWKTNTTAASQSVKWGLYTLPVQGAANPTGQLHFASNVNAAGYTSRAFVDTGGTFYASAFSFPAVTNSNIQATDGLSISFTTNTTVRAKVDGNDFRLIQAGGQFLLNNGGSGLVQAATAVVGLTNGSSSGGTFASVATSPSQITADQNNYNPGGSSFLQRWSTDASRQITGLVFTSAQVSGQKHEIWNVGSFDIVLVHQSASSTAANRFINSSAANYTLTPGQGATLTYDATTSRWRVSLLS